MQRLLTLFCAVLLSAGFLPEVQAQVQENRLFINGGLSIPVGDFADDSGSDAGAAGIGFTVVGDYLVPLGSPGLDWATSASVAVNTVDEDFFGGGDIDTGFWINVPALTGIRYQTSVSPTVDLFGLGQVGLNIMRAPSAENNDFDPAVEYSPGLVTTLGFSFGGGIVLNEGIQIGLRYNILGNPDIEFELENANIDEAEGEVALSIVQLTVGIPLGGN